MKITFILHEGRRIEVHDDIIEATFVKVSSSLGAKLISKYKDPVYHTLSVSASDQSYVPDVTRIIFSVENNQDLACQLKTKAKKQFNVAKQATVLVVLASMILVALTADSLGLVSDVQSYQITFALAAVAVADLIVMLFTKSKVW